MKTAFGLKKINRPQYNTRYPIAMNTLKRIAFSKPVLFKSDRLLFNTYKAQPKGMNQNIYN